MTATRSSPHPLTNTMTWANIPVTKSPQLAPDTTHPHPDNAGVAMTWTERWWPYLTVARFVGTGVLVGSAAGALVGVVREVSSVSHG